MEILVLRVGGFAGLTEQVAALNTAEMEPAAAQRVEQMIQSIGFFDLPATIPGGSTGADMYHYQITTIEGPRRHTVAFVEDDSPETAGLRKLVDHLQSPGQ